MKNIKILFAIVLTAGVFALPGWWYISADREENDPDLPAGVKIDKGVYLAAREEQIALLRGIDTAKPDSRSRAIKELEDGEKRIAARGESVQATTWRPLGPAPIPNGQTTGRTDPVSGRTVTLAVHPTDPNIVFAGTAQGGLYRTLDGGATWTPLMDSALSLAIGSVSFAPSDPSIIYVGTGEGGFSLDSFFGVGVYRINDVLSANPVLSEVLNRNAAGADVFSGRATGKVLVHPNDPNIIYVGTVSGGAGLGSSTGFTFPARGLYRSGNATGANPVFEKLTVSAASADRPILDAVFEPGDPNRMFVTLVDSFAPFLGDGGVYFTTNAQAASPTFTRVFTTGGGAELGRGELAIQKTGNTVTVYVAHGTSSGQVSKTSYDTTAPGTPAFTLAIDNNFCNGQCFYDIAVAVDPNDANRVYLAGSPALAFGFSTNGGTSFTTSAVGLHVDTHAIAVAPSDTNIIYYGSDGGVWRSANQGGSWVSLSNTTYSATQFQAIAVHPRDRHYTLGGTQDNGTNYLFPDGTTWTRAVGGDGGYVVIDSGSVSPTNMTSYHTFFNSSGSQIGFARSTTNQANGSPVYGNLLGCGGTANGIACADATLFYAPLVLGPNATGSTGNTVYFGSNKLYRSINQGTAMTAVSQTLPGTNERLSAIGISPQNDNIRLIGSTLGRVYYSNTTDASTMTDISAGFPARYVGRIAISPVDQNTAYVALGGFGIVGSHVMKTTNLNAAAPTWVASGNGIPDIPTNGLVIDPANPNTLYAGTDIGVFRSTDGAASWVPFSAGLPRVAVFEIVIQPTSRILKVATHGRGIYEYNLAATNAPPADFDGDGRSDLSVFRPGEGNWYRLSSQTGAFAGSGWGIGSDKLVPGDYDGDGRADLAVYRPAEGNWYLNRSTAGITQANFGLPTDLPVQGDYDGDGRTDLAVFRPSDGVWYISQSTAGFTGLQFGANGDKPVPGDYDGDGKTDVAVYRPSSGLWFINRSTTGFFAVGYGLATDRVVPGDYDGDGKTDIALYRESNGTWYMLRSQLGDGAVQFGSPGDIPTPGDYDGDGRFDVSIFRPSDGIWYRTNSANSSFFGAQFGATGDRPIPSAYLPGQ